MNFSEAEREAALTIIERWGEVSDACYTEVLAKLGRRISKQALRGWRREALRPKRKHRRVNWGDEADSGYAPEAPFVLPQETGANFPQDDLSGLPFDEQITERAKRSALRILTRLDSQEQADLLNGPALVKASREVYGLLKDVLAIDDVVLGHVGAIKALAGACAGTEIDSVRLIFDMSLHVERNKLASRPAAIESGESGFAVRVSEPIKSKVEEEIT